MKGKTQWMFIVLGLILALVGGVAGGYLFQSQNTTKDQLAEFDGSGLFSQVCQMRDFQSKRASSWNRTGKNADKIIIPAGEKHVLLKEAGAGCIKHIYWVYIIRGGAKERQEYFRGMVLRIFWDGADTPSIEVPIGDLFGVSNGLIRPINSLAFMTNPGYIPDERWNQGNQMKDASTWGFNCYLPMPFSRGAHIELENQTGKEAGIWYHFDYELYDDGAIFSDSVGRLHAQWNRENPTEGVPFKKGSDKWNREFRTEMVNLSGDENYAVLDVEGDGQFIGYFLTAFNFDNDVWTWWGEGDDMVFIDGEGFPPSIHGTGSEEIFGGGGCPTAEYTNSYSGFHCIENWNDQSWLGTNGMYRFYIQDPLRFQKSIRVTLEHGHGNNQSHDYSSVAFWYQRGINTNLPLLPPFKERLCSSMLQNQK